ncbi:FxsA family protein [Paenibacillus sp. GCM10012307]|uniref:FxsA family protein n=1 Tax=Paenibacillus roseus TaxID=2798579 RepID=A0A934J3C5_9BACL|nr:FxsA family protein [Paenibacillus roseus]MBJ6362040.1 FxsA family protein [Paenibacillus roseus]
MKWFIGLLLILPVIEVWGMIKMTAWIGGWTTFILILLTSVTGVYLARKEGLRLLLEAQRQMQSGQIPGLMMLDGLCVLLGALLLIVPGFITDLIGFSLIFPLTRPYYRGWLLGWMEAKVRKGSVSIRRW